MKEDWIKPEGCSSFREICVEFDRILTDEEIWQASGCIGYALREVLNGERLSEPLKVKRKGNGRTIVYYCYDSMRSASSYPDFVEAFEKAAMYVEEGSPIRKTDWAGPGTSGTRLAHGIGEVHTRFMVR
jgi:hypothetical protein